MAKPIIHLTKNGVKRRFHGGAAGRRCLSLKKFRERMCPRCKRRYRPQREWQKFCSRNCRWAINDKRKSLKRPKIKTNSTKRDPFGVVKCPVCLKRFSSTRASKKYCSWNCYKKRMFSNWKNANRKRGSCYDCLQPPLSGTVSRCEKHWLVQAAWRAGLRVKDGWVILRKKLEAQKWRCFYTGRILTLGVNASVDHIYARSTHPHLQGDIENLEWVDLEVNRAKRTLGKDAFIALCYEVSSRFPLQPSAKGCARLSPGADVQQT